jgi:hypothetical protein
MRKTILLVPFLASACGGDGTKLEIAGLPDSDTAFCVAVGADYMNHVGTMAVIGLPSMAKVTNLVPGAVSGDPVLRAYGDKLYVVNRVDSNITVVSLPDFAVEAQFSTGADSNPQDVAVSGSKAFVPLYAKGVLQVWDLNKTSAAPATIDLGSYDPDGLPQANSVAVAGGHAYVTLDLLDYTKNPPAPRGKGKIVVIDAATNAVMTNFDLTYTNPYNFMVARGDKLLVETMADFTGQSGCLEQIATDGTGRAAGCLVENRAFGGTTGGIAVGPTETYVAINWYDEHYKEFGALRRIGSDGKLADGSLSPESEAPTDVAYAPSGHLVYADYNAAGLRVYDLKAGRQITTAAIDIGLAPAAVNGIVCLQR